jgi:pimeloyl-ACP methyl ester carboxylesterase
MTSNDSKTHRLRDGRLLGYAEYGDPDGVAWFFFHGSGDSRLLLEPMADAAVRTGVRLISPDRPGVGLSEFQPKRSFMGWPSDVAELADALSVGQFVVAGGGGGAVHALACAHQIPSRLRATVISSCVPPRLEEMLPGRGDRVGVWLLRHASWLAPTVFGRRAAKVRSAPDKEWAHRLAVNDGEDLEFYRQPGRQQFWQGMQREAYRQGPRGVAQEMNLLARPWGFDLRDVTGKVFLWQGEHNPALGRSARAIAATLPDCEAVFVPTGGWLWVLSHPDELFSSVNSALGER